MVRIKKVKARKAYKCSRCGKAIEVGDEYFTYSKRTSYRPPRGVRVKRCLEHYPRPSETEGNPRRAQVYAIGENLQDEVSRIQSSDDFDPEEFETLVEDAIEEVRGIAEEIREGADNIEMGFGFATEQSEEMGYKADEIENVVSEMEQIEWPATPELVDDETYDEGELAEWKEKAVEALEEAIGHVDEVEV